MKNLKSLLVLLPFLALNASSLYATCSCTCCVCVTYTYDNAGNRTSRDVVDLSCMTIPDDTTRQSYEPPEDIELGNITATTEGSATTSDASETNEPSETDQPPLHTGSRDHVFKLYPNPTSGKVVIEAEPEFIDKAGSRYYVFDMHGRELISKDVSERYFTIDLTPYAYGSYIVHFQADGYSHEVKVIVRR